MPSLPARSVTLTCSVLLAVSVFAIDQVLELTAAVAAVHVLPLSTETYTVSPAAKLALSVPLMVCAAVLVMKSLAVPVSALKAIVAMVVLGATVSPTITSVLLAILSTPPTVNFFAVTLMSPLKELVEAVGVNVAVQTFEFERLCTGSDKVPPVTVTSSLTKPVGAAVKVKVTVAVVPALKDVLSAVMTTPGAETAVSDSRPLSAPMAATPALPATS